MGPWLSNIGHGRSRRAEGEAAKLYPKSAVSLSVVKNVSKNRFGPTEGGQSFVLRMQSGSFLHLVGHGGQKMEWTQRTWSKGVAQKDF